MPINSLQIIILNITLFIYRRPTTPSSVSDIASLAGLIDGNVHRLLDGVVVSCWVWFSPIGGCVALAGHELQLQILMDVVLHLPLSSQTSSV